MSEVAVNIATKNQMYSVAKYCKATTFGLRNKINIKDLFYTQLLLLALEYDENFSVLDADERAILLSQVSIPIGSNRNNCSTC